MDIRKRGARNLQFVGAVLRGWGQDLLLPEAGGLGAKFPTAGGTGVRFGSPRARKFVFWAKIT